MMKHLIHSQQNKLLSCMLIGASALYGQTAFAAEDDAKFYPQLDNQECLADYSDMGLNCTANDVRVSQVVNIKGVKPGTFPPEPDLSGDPVSCRPGDPVTFFADVEVVTTANERYDYAVWLPGGSYSPQEPSTPEQEKVCSVLIGDNRDPSSASGWIDGLSFEFDIDKKAGTQTPLDYCTDISKASPYSGVHTYYEQLITMTCLDDDGSGKADFNYCMSWNQRAEAGCDANTPSPAGAPSKCRCDIFDVDILIDPPGIVKSLESSTPLDEPGGNFIFKVSIENINPNSSLFITSLTDYLDFNDAGTFGKVIDLWGSTETPAGDGVYLIENSTACPKPAPGGSYEILAKQIYTCQFTLKVVADDLPDLPVGYLEIDDIVKASIENQFGVPVLDGDSCPAALSAIDGDHCSEVKTVKVNNVSPDIDVTKTVSPTQLAETAPGVPASVTYTVTVKNTSTKDALIITESDISDTPYALTSAEKAPCVGTLAIGASCVMTYTRGGLVGNSGDSIVNTATVYAVDNENDSTNDSGTATVVFTDVPGALDLTKTPNKNSVLESGEDVVFTFVITNESPTDRVQLKSMVDTVFGTIFDSASFQGTCNFYNTWLEPAGDSVSCTITKFLIGEPSDPDHENWATVTGVSDDNETLTATDNAIVSYEDVPTDFTLNIGLLFEFSINIKNNSDFEPITLDEFNLGGVPFEGGLTGDGFEVINIDCPVSTDLPYEIGVLGNLNCSFRVNVLNPSTSAYSVLDGGDDVELIISDNDGNTAAQPSYNIKVQAVPNL
ncbi:DUF11 domain-containing protein [Vibrio parahaemolyticus]|uniref:DUF11 domain-containing protein n=1 Tax=Vibrio mediterranei TaxID=689 RepID=UPI0040677182